MSHAFNWKRMGVLAAAGLALASPGLLGQAKTQSPPGPREQSLALPVTSLYPSGKVEFSAPPPVAVSGGAQCDTDGNIYVQYAPSVQLIYQMVESHESVGNIALRKLSLGSHETVKFPVGPFQGYTRFSGVEFYVTPNGRVYNLAEACKPGDDPKSKRTCALLITKYNGDGSVDSVHKIHPPEGLHLEHLNPTKFAVFPDGNLLLTGLVVDKTRTLRPFTFIFDSSGDFLTKITLQHDVGPMPTVTSRAKDNSAAKTPTSNASQSARVRQANSRTFTAVAAGLMVGAPDGTVYLLRTSSPARLYVVSSGGSVLREVNIKPPRPDLKPITMSVAGGSQLFLDYVHVPISMADHPDSALALVDPQTGVVITIYDSPPPKAGAPACMTREGEIVFMQESKTGHLQVNKYSPLR